MQYRTLKVQVTAGMLDRWSEFRIAMLGAAESVNADVSCFPIPAGTYFECIPGAREEISRVLMRQPTGAEIFVRHRAPDSVEYELRIPVEVNG